MKKMKQTESTFCLGRNGTQGRPFEWHVSTQFWKFSKTKSTKNHCILHSRASLSTKMKPLI